METYSIFSLKMKNSETKNSLSSFFVGIRCDSLHLCTKSYFVDHSHGQVYIMLAKPEKNVRSAFTTSTVVRMHVGDAKKAAKTGKSSSSMANLFRRRGSTQDNIR